MIQLAVWTMVALILAVVGIARPNFVLSIFIIMRLLIPSQAGGLIIGDWQGNAALHPATILLLVYAGVVFVARRRQLAEELSAHIGVYSTMLFLSAIFLVVSVIQSGPSSVAGLTNVVLTPFVLVLIARMDERARPGSLRHLATVYVITMICIAGIVAVQAVFETNFPWGFRYPALSAPGTGEFRPLGTFDSPLDLGFASAVAIPLLAGTIQKSLARISGALVLLLSVVLSESRAPTLVAVLGCVWLISVTARTSKAFLASVSVIVAAVVVVNATPVLSGLLVRFRGEDGNSSSQRLIAAEYVQENIFESLFAGGGWGSAYELRGTVLRTSLENSYAILSFDLGLIFTIILLFLQFRIIFLRGGLPGARLAALSGICLAFLYSGLVIMSAASTALWLALCLCIPPVRQDEGAIRAVALKRAGLGYDAVS